MILPMARVEILGPRDLLPRTLEILQAQGVLELRAPRAAAPGVAPLRPAEPVPDAAGRQARLADALARIDALAARLGPPHAAAATACTVLPAPGTEALVARLAALAEELDGLEARRAALAEERVATERFSDLVVALAPLRHGLEAAAEPELHGLVLRTDPAALRLLEAEVARITAGTAELQSRALDAERTGILIAVPRAHAKAVAALLYERGVDEVRLPAAYAGRRLVDVLLLLAARARALPGEIAQLDAERAALAAEWAPALAHARGEAEAARDQLEAAGRCGQTRFAFVAAGYMPVERVPALLAAARGVLGDRVAVSARPPEPGEWHEVPVVLRNRRWIRPFELLLALVPLPRYGSLDPTPWLALTFPLFFGLVLGDLAFGAAGIAVALVLRRRGTGGALGRDVAWIALWCSVSAALFGAVFGEALGELGAHVGIHPILLDRRRAILALLWLAVGVGGAHVALGMVLGVVSALRGGHVREALARAAKLGVLASAAVGGLAAVGAIPRVALTPAAVAGGGALIAAVLAEGPLAALELVLGVGNVLSYARLMALGLASVMLAEVANGIASGLRPAALGLAIAVLLHAVNFTLGLLSPAIAALRLHYVEFFEKFYDPGGAPFRPFARPA
ncbi:V-type ATP synthase subunit I [Anaeromyxobacter oryzae]|uniref:V-type ATP synthase subunit I n=1 Tax=Anaeromyxobacter oryzae TaxID=2918170 RepID=A0ABM7X2R6_9BACT|nr:ATPase [Anaeromyxobacter oryzae]BDG06093.1 hypothetical protein AMOR_50890 [Anaeromyxobacter oryzae]